MINYLTKINNQKIIFYDSPMNIKVSTILTIKP